jgi:uncharacterized protein YyaL (SSP411 family)
MPATRSYCGTLALAGAFALGCLGDVGAIRADDAPAATTPAPAKPAQHKHPANRLARETSPYLLLHAHNPVDWYPWGPEALEAAKKANKPIFLSIGYSSCFWCHVMEREVFENAEIAKFMNASFINVKVDREERPDLDDIYMTALQVYLQAAGSNQGGGWPLSLFLTPEGHPIAGGTYFPPQDMPGRPGFPNVSRTILKAWTDHETDVRKAGAQFAAEVRRLMKPQLTLQPAAVTRAMVDQSVAGCLQQFDPQYGGLDFNPQQPNKPKFPVPSRLMLLQAQAGRKGANPQALVAVDKTLDAMAAGGIYDHLAGGFHRYSTDRMWRVPHFEKMLYDNAQLASVYSHAYQRTNRKSYRQTAEETFAFVLNELTDPKGGFYSALDAETNGIEGAHYVWSRDEVNRVLGQQPSRVFQAAYGMDQAPFFEHGYVLQFFRPLATTAQQLRLPEAQLQSQLAEMRTKLLAIREARPKLLKDDKVLTSWSGLMITAFADGGRILKEPKYIAAAEKAALFLAQDMRSEDGQLRRTWRNGEAKLDAYLEDYAYLIQGLLSLHEATGDEKWVHAARRLMDDQVTQFWDPQEKGFYFTSHDHEALLARTKDAYDSVLPSGNSVSVRNLVKLAKATGDARYREYATDTLRVFGPTMQRSPGSLPYMALALQEYIDAFGEIPASATSPPPSVATAPPMPQPPMPQPAATTSPTATGDKLQPWAVQPADETGKHKAHAKVYFGADQLTPGKSTPVAVVIDIDDPWHLNANPPQPDFVVPTEITLASKLGVTLANIHYPPGHEFQMEGIDESLLVYERQVTLFADLAVPAEAAGQSDELTLTLRYQACNDKTCSQPLKVDFTAPVKVTAAGAAVQPINGPIFAKAPPPMKP